VLGPTALPIADAITYCRTMAASLASIHSHAEQVQAAELCKSADPSWSDTGSTVGCWIGLEDSAQGGGFIWSDGSNVDFVNWSPGEPNSGVTESAVSISYRNWRQAGEWNDEPRAPPDLSAHGGRGWGVNVGRCPIVTSASGLQGRHRTCR
jgi:hypothetical protein